jgi:signal transduction histidine kinase
MQTLIAETVALLGDHSGQSTYDLSGPELAAIILDRNAPLSAKKGVLFSAQADFDQRLDSHRGSLVCLIANNLIENAVEATPSGGQVQARLTRIADRITLTVRDQGGGIPEGLQAHLFEPGRSGRPGGSGLGLAISRLLARQIGANLTLASTDASGTVFSLTFPDASPIDEMT